MLDDVDPEAEKHFLGLFNGMWKMGVGLLVAGFLIGKVTGPLSRGDFYFLGLAILPVVFAFAVAQRIKRHVFSLVANYRTELRTCEQCGSPFRRRLFTPKGEQEAFCLECIEADELGLGPELGSEKEA